MVVMEWGISAPLNLAVFDIIRLALMLIYPDALKSPCSALFRLIRLFVYIFSIIYSPLYSSISLNFPLY